MRSDDEAQDTPSSDNGDSDDETDPVYKGQITPYSGEFARILIDNNTYPDQYMNNGKVRPPPSNIGQLQDMLAERRPSTSTADITDDQFRHFRCQHAKGDTHKGIVIFLFPMIAGPDDKHYHSGGLTKFRLKPLQETLFPPKPDIYYGTKQEEINRRVQHDLQDFIRQSNGMNSAIAPNLFVELKERSKNPKVTSKHCVYDGMIGARAMFELQNYKKPKAYDGNAYTLSFGYDVDVGTLVAYATHPAPPGNEDDERVGSDRGTRWLTTLVGSWALISSRQGFEDGVRAFRNAREWAKQTRDTFIAQANETVRSLPPLPTKYIPVRAPDPIYCKTCKRILGHNSEDKPRKRFRRE